MGMGAVWTTITAGKSYLLMTQGESLVECYKDFWWEPQDATGTWIRQVWLYNFKILVWFKLPVNMRIKHINHRTKCVVLFPSWRYHPSNKILRSSRVIYSTTCKKYQTNKTYVGLPIPLIDFYISPKRFLSFFLQAIAVTKNIDRVSSRTRPPRAVAGVPDRPSSGGRAAPPRGELVLLLAPHWTENLTGA